MRLGQKITELRKKNNLSQEGLAEKMNVSRQPEAILINQFQTLKKSLTYQNYLVLPQIIY